MISDPKKTLQNIDSRQFVRRRSGQPPINIVILVLNPSLPIVVSIMSNVSKRIAEFIKARPSMQITIRPLAGSYIGLAGHRRIGLK